jgi:prepilin-type N-terminal cleavage/methylation domain-containing protein
MNVPKLSKKEGFTIIEVVLVLAIVALILLMIFIALPALQRGQRDTARKNDVGIVASAVNSYIGNNRGTFPTTGTLATYVTNISGNTTTVTVNTTTGAQTLSAARVVDGAVIVTQKTTCGASTTTQVLGTGTARQFTVTTRLEAGGGVAFCQDS